MDDLRALRPEVAPSQPSSGDDPDVRELTRAVILGGGHATTIFPLANFYSKLEFPLAGEPLLAHQSRHLGRFGVTDIAVLAPPRSTESPTLCALRGGALGENVSIQLIPDLGLRGTAGALSVLKPYLRSAPFLVIGGNVFPIGFDLEPVLRRHRERRAGITAVVQASTAGAAGRGHVLLDPDDQVLAFDADPTPADGRPTLSFSGIYFCDPIVLDFIRDEGYMDFKEQFIPRLRQVGISVHVYRAEEPLRSIETAKDYYELNRDILLAGGARAAQTEPGRTQIRSGVWVGRNVTVAPDVEITGPVVIGDDTSIDRGAEITGPVTLGSGCHVGEGVRIRDSLVWDGVDLQPGADVETCIVSEGCTVHAGASTERLVLVSRSRRSRPSRVPRTAAPSPAPGLTFDDARGASTWAAARSRAARWSKRSFDIAVAAIGMLVLSPLFLTLALLIKLDSRGPIFFRQTRCGRGGRDFRMLKLRTMVGGADRQQERLRQSDGNMMDGPMFKMQRDPRVTRVGRFLRGTSLDELPQLTNVLMGHMSLVGPRPLERKEMQFSPGWRDTRLQVRPGITGLWQVYGRNSHAFHDWIRYDVEYVRNWSLWLDLKILAATFLVLWRGR